MAKGLTKAEKIASEPIEKFAKYKGESGIKVLQNAVRTLQAGYKRRVGSFKRKGLISHAQLALEKTLPPKQRKISDMSRNQLILEVARYSKFFNDETSTEKGIRRVNKEQDIRIFGKDKRGRPLRTMSPEERIDYWDLYDEFLNVNPTESYKYGSEQVQKMLADVVFSGTGKETIMEILDATREKLKKSAMEKRAKEAPNVYRGRGPNFKGRIS